YRVGTSILCSSCVQSKFFKLPATSNSDAPHIILYTSEFLYFDPSFRKGGLSNSDSRHTKWLLKIFVASLYASESVFPFFSHSSIVCRSEEHTSELQSRENLVCRLLLEKK